MPSHVMSVTCYATLVGEKGSRPQLTSYDTNLEVAAMTRSGNRSRNKKEETTGQTGFNIGAHQRDVRGRLWWGDFLCALTARMDGLGCWGECGGWGQGPAYSSCKTNLRSARLNLKSGTTRFFSIFFGRGDTQRFVRFYFHIDLWVLAITFLFAPVHSIPAPSLHYRRRRSGNDEGARLAQRPSDMNHFAHVLSPPQRHMLCCSVARRVCAKRAHAERRKGIN